MPKNYAVPEYSKRAVIDAGRLLGREIPYDKETTDKEIESAVEAFRIAENWRSAHAYPLREVHAELSQKVRACQLEAPTGARLKRMPAIRKKLATKPYNLHQMQDIGGCRVILPDMGAFTRVAKEYRLENTSHELVREDDYVLRPRRGGYRAHHFVLKYLYGKDQTYKNQRIEVQIRTRLQHAWSTAVEVVGSYIGDDLKGGTGDGDWLRFFEIASAEFASREQCPLAENVPQSEAERREELIALNRKLRAIQMLAHFGQSPYRTHDIDTADGGYFLVTLDNRNRSVQVGSYKSAIVGADHYRAAERAGGGATDTVLVEADKIENVRVAFANYFMDVQLFFQIIRGLMPAGEEFWWLGNWRPRR